MSRDRSCLVGSKFPVGTNQSEVMGEIVFEVILDGQMLHNGFACPQMA